MKKMKLVMVGNGMAGVRTLEELLKLAPDLYDVTVFGAEPHPNYNRILLSPVLAGEQTLDEIVLNPLAWYSAHGITLRTGKKVVQVDRRRRIVTINDGTEAEYDRLLLATGSNPFIPSLPGKDLEGVIAYRDIADTNYMIETARTHRHAVVIGGGLLGLEAANGLMLRGMSVTVVHLSDVLMERQLDHVAGRLLQRALEDRGLKFRMGAHTQELVGDASGRVKAVKFKDGSEVPADLVVMAAGVRPNTELAEAIGIHCNRGVVVTDTMQSVTDPRVYAVGECASHRGVAYGLVAPLFEQGKVCANHLALFGIGRYTGSQTSTKLKVTGVDLFSAGDFVGGEGTEEIVLSDPFGSVYKKLVIKGDKLVGACMYGDTADGSYYFQLIREGTSIRDRRDTLMFGAAASDMPVPAQALVPASAAGAQVSAPMSVPEKAISPNEMPYLAELMRQCAEACAKEVKAIRSSKGWALHVAGTEGASDGRAALLAEVRTPDEALAYAGAFLQLYREEGQYQEHAARYVGRVGLAHVHNKIVRDQAGRHALWGRLQTTLTGLLGQAELTTESMAECE
ncbi:MAG: NAD(P)/FAD-dependent oxidoreductase [Aquabacterium sp.]|jgi:nitrite reductase (NADH) large subunit|nr:NAD(P)/FAD-dependent oxidoreductase [Aquabacterium sp.]MDQ5926404.1 nitrite reductase large subunit [Pseudomonadota bacterium]